jgi:hypothetical protein
MSGQDQIPRGEHDGKNQNTDAQGGTYLLRKCVGEDAYKALTHLQGS